MITRRDFLVMATALAIQRASARGARGAAAPPAVVLLMRHAEEPGQQSSVHLNKRGQARAAALARLFPARFATPDMLFAARASKQSNRSVETLEPLAKALHLSLDDSFADGQYQRLAAAILARPDCAQKHILICWHHGTLPQLASALGAVRPPARWPDKQYDHVWQLRYAPGGVVFTDLPQRLLPDDGE